MEKIWLKSYPPGVPAEVDWSAHRSIGDLFEAKCTEYAARPAFCNMGRTISFGDLRRMSRHFAAWLQSLGLARGTRVAIMMPNCLQIPLCLFGVLRAGCTVVNVNPLYTPRELQHQLRDSGAEVIVILENFAHVLQQVLPDTAVKHVVVASLGDLLGVKGLVVNLVVRHVKRMVPAWHIPGARRFNEVMASAVSLPFEPPVVEQDDVAFLQYTGGTTGVAKGATLLHRNILANLEQSAAWVNPFVASEVPQIIITALPLYHIFSLTANCLLMLKLGGLNVLITNPRDMPGFIKELQRHRFTMFTGVNTLFNGLLNQAAFSGVDFTALRVTLGGGMAVQKTVAERWKKLTGCTLVEAYGLSETSPAAIINPMDLQDFNGSIGLPIPSTEVSIRSDDGKEVPLGQSGEICIRGPQVMPGYWQQPESTAAVMTPDGYFMTGDLGTMDERGYVRIVDRKKDMIKVSGFNVYPNEVEAVVASLPGVLECAAIGVPDEHSGEALKLFVVRKDPALTEEDVRKYCHDNLTGYKRPRHIEFRQELPKSNVGKILRRALRDDAVPAAPARQ
jgi:long-chain acyl-CoA synthetase